MNWSLFFMLGSLTLIAGIFVGLVYWANWDEITGKKPQSNISKKLGSE
ncbi:hypothetical protein ACFGW0_10055 [Pasteurella multocida]